MLVTSLFLWSISAEGSITQNVWYHSVYKIYFCNFDSGEVLKPASRFYCIKRRHIQKGTTHSNLCENLERKSQTVLQFIKPQLSFGTKRRWTVQFTLRPPYLWYPLYIESHVLCVIFVHSQRKGFQTQIVLLTNTRVRKLSFAHKHIHNFQM